MKRGLVVLALLCLCSLIYSYNEYHIQLAASAGSNINVSRCDFRGAGSLFQENKVDFVGAQAAGVSFATCEHGSKVAGVICIPGQVTDLSGYDFRGAELVSANFTNAILKGADFTGANIELANFTGADLTGAKIGTAQNVSTAIFCDAIMPDGKKCSGKSWTGQGKNLLCRCSK